MTRRAILFLQLGGPERLSEVRGFLYRLFSDPEVIRVKSVLLRKTIAASIAITRSGTSKKMYEKIGGGSPIRRLTDEQSAGVKRLLRDSRRDTEIETAMMCSSPLVEEVVEGLARKGVDRFLAFPLYPQYSLTTTKGALDRSRQAVARFAPNARLFEMGSFPAHPLFLEAHAEQIREQLDRFPDRSPGATLILFSAHSIPKRLIDSGGDPYAREIGQTVDGITALLDKRARTELAYQSKLGPIEWLGPATADRIVELGRAGEKQVLVVPIAFVTDHIETLYEIDQLFGEAARRAGITQFRRTPGLNSHPRFLECLKDLALSSEEFWQ